MTAPFEIMVGRIETLALDAIVNAANRQLQPGTGVDGAIRAAAGPALTEHTDNLAELEDGGAVLTPGFKLPAKYIIHTAAPIWSAGDEGAKVAGSRAAICRASASRTTTGSRRWPSHA